MAFVDHEIPETVSKVASKKHRIKDLRKLIWIFPPLASPKCEIQETVLPGFMQTDLDFASYDTS